MRFIHTADWHIGRTLHGVSLLDDQRHVLESLSHVIRDTKPEALVIAGDVYDRAVPAADAVRLLNEFLNEIVLAQQTPVLMIAGNHDDADRLAFGSQMLSSRGLHVRGPFSNDLTPVTIEDEHGKIDFCLIPYDQGVPLNTRTLGERDDVRSFDDAMSIACGAAFKSSKNDRRVAVAHCFAAGGNVSDSERPLSVGGSDQVSTAHFKPFHYTALGHLHRPQTMAENVVYAGSLLKYSFSEADHKKSVSLVEVSGDGSVKREELTLDTKRDVRIVEGSFEQLLNPADSPSNQDFVLARITDSGVIHDALARLRKVYPNVLHIERPALIGSSNAGETSTSFEATSRLTPVELFSEFFEQIAGEPLSSVQLEHANVALAAAEQDDDSP